MRRDYFFTGLCRIVYIAFLVITMPFIGLAQTNIAPQAVVTAMGTGAPGCMTGPCSTMNDLNLGTCGTQQMWISTMGPPSTVPGDDYLQFDFPTIKTFDEIIIHHATANTARFLTGGLIQYWDGVNWITHHHFTNLPNQCVNSIPIQKLTAERFRITSFELNGPGQVSNPNFREIEIISAPTSFNDAMVISVDSPITFCSGPNDIYATIGNYGLNQINSVEVHWEVNGVVMPVIYYGQLLDTLNGNFPNTAQIHLGNVNLNAGFNTVRVYTMNPNGAPDQFSANDTVEVIVKSASAPANGLAFQNIGLTSADVFILDGTGNYDYEYGLTGYTQGTGTMGSINSDMFVLSGLAHSTSYDVYIRTDCGGGDVSAWVGPFSFYTAAAIPYKQDFENFGTNFGGIINIEGWNNTASSAPEWETGTNTSSFGTGPAEDHTIGTGGTFVYLESSGGSLGDFDSLISPPIFIDSSTTSLTVEFWYHMHGLDMGRLDVYIDTNGVTQLIDSIVGQQHVNETDPWLLSTTHLTGYEGSSIQLIFKGTRGNGLTSDMSVDDVRVMETPSCLEPTNLSASNITLSSADLDWVENNVATQWEIEYGPQGFTQGSGTVSLINSKPFALTGLTASTDYQFYVRSICGRGDTSFWAGPFIFMTSIGIPYIEDFENFPAGITSNPWPNAWSSSTSTDPRWETEDATGFNENSFATGPLYDHTLFGTPGGIYVYMETSGGTTGDTAEFVSPPIFVDTNLSSITVDYWYFLHGTNIDKMDVYIESNGVRTLLASYVGQQQANQTDPWLYASHVLTGYSGQMIQVVFSGLNPPCCTGDLAIDDVRIIETPSCIQPSNLTASNITKNAVDIGWTENNVATQWEIEYDTTGFVLGTGSRIAINTNPYGLSGLNSGASYDFYVRSICGRGDTSFWAGPFKFTTLFPPSAGGVIPIPPYGNTYTGTSRGFWFTAPTDFIITGLRVPTDIGLADQNIHLVRFSAPPPAYAASTTAFTTLGYWNGIPGATIVATSIEVKQGDIIGVLGTRGTNSTNSYGTPAGVFQSTILGQPVTLTRLLYQDDIHLNPAANFSEEVNGNIARVEIYHTPPASGMNNAATVSVDSLQGFCAGPQDVYATIKNSGNNRIDSVEVHWEVNGVLQSVVHYQQLLDTFNGSFPREASILLGTANLVSGSNTIKVWTAMPNGLTDTINDNDTIVSTLFSPSAPVDAIFSNIQTTSVDVDVRGAAGSIDYEYGTNGFLLGNGTSGSSATNPFSISGLLPNTLYDVYVRNNCGGSSPSNWAGPFTFRTAIAVPYFQDFENFGTNFGGINNIEGWNNTATSTPEWESGTSTSSSGTGPVEDHTIGAGGTFVFLETSGGLLGDFDSLISPAVYIDSNLNGLTVEFWYHMHGADMGQLEVYIDTNGVTNLLTTIVGQQQLNQMDPWLYYSANLTGYEGSTVRLIFRGVRGNGFTSDMAVDDVRIMETPTCIRPSSLTAFNVSSDSAEISWVENNIATQWVVEYGTSGFTLGTGIDTLVGSNPVVLSGLSPNTAYEFYVKSICGRSDSSIWSGPYRFITECVAVNSFPYVENFDGNTNNGVWDCWTVYNIDGGDTWVQDNIFLTAQSSPFVAHGMGNNNDMLISPQFDLPTTPMWLKLYDIVESSTYNNIYSVLVSTTGTDTSDFTDTLATFDVSNTTWTERTIDLSAYANQNIYIALWQSYSAATFFGFGVDDFTVEQRPSCIKPSNFTALNSTLTSADISWTENNVATQWEIEYGPAGFTKGAGTTSIVSTNPVTISGLNPSSSYDIYVRSICGRGDTSVWEGPFTFMTAMGVPFIEDFESFPPGLSSNPWPNGWISTTSSDPVWESEDATGFNENSVNTGPLYDHTLFGTPGGLYMYMETSGGTTGDTAEFISAPIYVDSSITSLTLDYWYFLYGANIHGMDVLVESNGVRTLVATYVGQQQTAQTDPWLKGSHVLTGNYAGQSVQLIFRGVNVNCCTGDIAIDDVRLIETPTCIQPSNLLASNISMNSADLGWTEMNVASQWEIEYGPAGYTQGMGTSQIVSTNPVSITGLNPSTSYDFYVRSICGTGDTSFWSGPYQFKTDIGVPYFEDFELFGNSSPANVSGWTVLTSSGVEWVSSTTTPSGSTGPDQDHTIGAGGTFVFLETSFGSTGDTAHFISPPIYLDTNFNNVDFEFWYHKYGATMDELLVFVESNGISTLLTSIAGQTHTSGTDPWLSYNTVLSGYAGQTIQLRFSGIRGSSFTGDMAIDDISISPQVPIDGSLVNFAAPLKQNCYSSAENVEVRLVNTGINSLDFTVDSTLITVDLTGASTQTISVMVNNNSLNAGNPLPPLDTMTIMVGTVDMTNPGTYFLDADLSMANDGVGDNNAVADTIVGSKSGTVFGPSTMCTGDSATLFITGHRGNVQWQVGSGGTFVDIVGATSSSVKVGPTTSSDYRALVCGNLLSDTITLNPVTPSQPLATDSMLTVFCGNTGVVALTASSVNSNPKFEWYASPTGGSALRVGGNVFDISLYGDTLYYQAAPSLGTQSIDTFYVQEVVLSGSGICASSRDTSEAIIDCIVGIDEETEIVSNISIQPNPSKGVFKVVGSNVKEEVQISIFNANGKLVFRSADKLSNNFEERIDISGLAKGLYFVKLQSDSSMEMKKIVLQ